MFSGKLDLMRLILGRLKNWLLREESGIWGKANIVLQEGVGKG